MSQTTPFWHCQSPAGTTGVTHVFAPDREAARAAGAKVLGCAVGEVSVRYVANRGRAGQGEAGHPSRAWQKSRAVKIGRKVSGM